MREEHRWLPFVWTGLAGGVVWALSFLPSGWALRDEQIELMLVVPGGREEDDDCLHMPNPKNIVQKFKKLTTPKERKKKTPKQTEVNRQLLGNIANDAPALNSEDIEGNGRSVATPKTEGCGAVGGIAEVFFVLSSVAVETSKGRHMEEVGEKESTRDVIPSTDNSLSVYYCPDQKAWIFPNSQVKVSGCCPPDGSSLGSMRMKADSSSDDFEEDSGAMVRVQTNAPRRKIKMGVGLTSEKNFKNLSLANLVAANGTVYDIKRQHSLSSLDDTSALPLVTSRKDGSRQLTERKSLARSVTNIHEHF